MTADGRGRVPRASYRLQLRKGFGFAEAEGLVGYLGDLGISDLYVSPILAARPGSTHGYDVTDPSRFNPELGSDAQFVAMADALRSRGMGLLVDIVPNHMAASPENPWWWDVLLRGRASPHAEWFDIDWERGGDRVVLPVLGAPLRDVLARAEIRLSQGPAGAELRYFDHRFPVSGPAEGGLEQVLERQHYRLICWKDGPREVNYRRFFDVSGLVGVNAWRDEVFAAQHGLILGEVRAGRITGLRIDHIDGLRAPGAYLARLGAEARAPGGAPVFLVVEKILAPGERLPEAWPVDGTTGYDALNNLGALFVAPDGLGKLVDDAREELGLPPSFEDECDRCKRLVMEQMFPGDFAALSRRLGPAREAAAALDALSAALPVYRTYLDAQEPAPSDRKVLEQGAQRAGAAHPELAAAAQRLARSMIDGRTGDGVQRWQQLTGAVMAKGVEDTAMYRWIALTSLNEVGGHPVPGPDPVARFHEENALAAARSPHRLIATSTHDTKRSEDVRARISVLSEIPDLWLAAIERWHAMNEAGFSQAAGEPAPSARDEVLLYQTLVGAWPLVGEPDEPFIARIQAYMVKAAKEAKLRTSWTDPDAEYERALESFVSRTLTDPGLTRDLGAFQQLTARLGALGALAQLVLKCAAPGIPDFYQGSELWDLSLVDPDNRRPVDFDRRRRELGELRARWDQDPAATIDTCLGSWRDGRIKLLLTWRMLETRTAAAELFARGDYLPLRADGDHAENVVVFARRHEGRWALVCAARLANSLEHATPALALERAGWGRTSIVLPEGAPANWRDAITGRRPRPARGRLDAADILAPLPGAVLLST
jgi:malto-oligosyltrehalose synthase